MSKAKEVLENVIISWHTINLPENESLSIPESRSFWGGIGDDLIYALNTNQLEVVSSKNKLLLLCKAWVLLKDGGLMFEIHIQPLARIIASLAIQNVTEEEIRNYAKKESW